MMYLRFIGPDGCEHIVEGKRSVEGYYSFPFPRVIEPGEYWTIEPVDAEKPPPTIRKGTAGDHTGRGQE